MKVVDILVTFLSMIKMYLPFAKSKNFVVVTAFRLTNFLIPSLKHLGLHSNNNSNNKVFGGERKMLKHLGKFETKLAYVSTVCVNGNDYFVLIQLITFSTRLTKNSHVGFSLAEC